MFINILRRIGQFTKLDTFEQSREIISTEESVQLSGPLLHQKLFLQGKMLSVLADTSFLKESL